MSVATVRRLWPVLIPVAFAWAYSLYQVQVEVGVGSSTVTADSIMSLLSDGRIQTFLVLPAWLVGTAFAIHNARQPVRLIRSGSWGATVLEPLLHSLAVFGAASTVTLGSWAVTLLALRGDWSIDVAWALLAGAAEVLLLSGVLTAIYSFTTAAHLLVGTPALIIVPATVWLWAALSNIGVTYGSAWDVSRYMSIHSVRSSPGSLLVIGGVLLATGALAWLVAYSRDRATATADRGLPAMRTLVEAAGLLLVVVGALGAEREPGPVELALTGMFFGAAGSLAKYLLGATILTAVGVGTVLALGSDLGARSQLVITRFGSLGRWFTRVMLREGLRAAVYLLLVIVVAVATRVLVSRDHISSEGFEAALHLYVRLTAGGFFVLAVAASMTLAFRSATAGIAAVATLVMIGLIPAGGSPFNPVTTWSMCWWRVADLETAISSAVAAIAGLAALVAAGQKRRIW